MRPKIVINVKGGIIQEVCANMDISYIIVDDDAAEGGYERISAVSDADRIFKKTKELGFGDLSDLDVVEIDKAMELLKNKGYILSGFTTDDIKSKAKNMGYKLSKDELKRVLYHIDRIDANDGINWESIAVIIETIKS